VSSRQERGVAALLVAALALALVAAAFVAIGLVSSHGADAFLAGAVSSGGSLLLIGLAVGRSSGPLRPSRR
jgi:hypothetical protein